MLKRFKFLVPVLGLLANLCSTPAYSVTCSKITDCVALTSVANNDLLYIVDVSDTTIAATGSGKKITRSNLLLPNLMAIDGVTSAADKLFYFTGSGTGAVTSFTSTGRTLVGGASASAMRTTLGTVIGTDVQAYSANLDAVAAVTVTAAGTALLDDANAAAQRTTLGLGTIATQAASAVTITGGAISGTTLAGATGGSYSGAGFVGEVIQANLASASPTSLSTTVNTDIISAAYTAGNWWVSSKGCVIYSGVTSTNNLFFVGTATGDNQTGITNYDSAIIEHPTAGGSGTACGTIEFPYTASGSGSLFLKINSTFTVGTQTGYGTISMMRMP